MAVKIITLPDGTTTTIQSNASAGPDIYPDMAAAQAEIERRNRVASTLGGDTGSSATGSAAPGQGKVTNINGQSTSQTGGIQGAQSRASNMGSSFGSGGTNAGSDQGPPSSIGGESARPGAWYGGLADQLYGQTYDVNNADSFWRDITNMHMGIPGFNSTASWLGNLIGNPYGLAEAMGNTNNMMSNFGALNAMTGIEDNILGKSNMSFDPRALIGSVMSQLANFDPNKVTVNPDGTPNLNGQSMLALQLYDPDPQVMMGNIVNFLVGDNGILKGIMPGPAFSALQNAFAIIGGPQGNFGASIRQDPHGLENSTPAKTVGFLNKALQSFGIL